MMGELQKVCLLLVMAYLYGIVLFILTVAR